jgi:hypothetical protein
MAPHGLQTATSVFGFSPSPCNWKKPCGLVQDCLMDGAGSWLDGRSNGRHHIAVGTGPTYKGQAVIKTTIGLRVVVWAIMSTSPKDAEAIYPTAVRRFRKFR